MRGFFSLIAVILLASSSASASSSARLQLDIAMLADAATLVRELGSTLPGMTRPSTSTALPTLALSTSPSFAAAARQVPPHYAWVEGDTRAFWYAAGAGAVTTLGTHILIGLPTLFIAGNFVSPLLAESSPMGLVVIGGVFAAYTLVESSLSSLVSMLVFNSMSQTYEAQYLTGLLSHFGGAMVATTVTSLTFGLGLLMMHGTGVLVPFTGGAGIQTLNIFSLLGAMPAAVIAATALVAVPALTTSWGLAAGARPRAGYAVDEQWQQATLIERADDPTRDRHAPERVAVIGVPIALP